MDRNLLGFAQNFGYQNFDHPKIMISLLKPQLITVFICDGFSPANLPMYQSGIFKDQLRIFLKSKRFFLGIRFRLELAYMFHVCCRTCYARNTRIVSDKHDSLDAICVSVYDHVR